MALVNPEQLKLLTKRKRKRGERVHSVITIGLKSDAHTVRFEVPIKAVNITNLHESWRDRYFRESAHRTVSWVECLNSMNLLRYAAILRSKRKIVVLTRYAPQLLDEGDNLPASMKSVRDGIAEALGVDDGPKSRVTWEYKQVKAQGYTVGVEIKACGELKPLLPGQCPYCYGRGFFLVWQSDKHYCQKKATHVLCKNCQLKAKANGQTAQSSGTAGRG